MKYRMKCHNITASPGRSDVGDVDFVDESLAVGRVVLEGQEGRLELRDPVGREVDDRDHLLLDVLGLAAATSTAVVGQVDDLEPDLE